MRLNAGDSVRDVVGMRGVVVRPGLVYTRVNWGDHTTWIKTRYLERVAH